jgi:hypothetical protein
MLAFLYAVLMTIVPHFGTVPASGHVGHAPSVVEDGSDLELFSSLGNMTRQVAFDPAGFAYSEYGGGILRVGPDGSQTFIPADERSPTAYPRTIIYSAGYLWFAVYGGYGFETTTGTNGSFHAQDFTDPTAAPDGIYTNPFPGEIQHTDLNFKRTIYPVYLPGAQVADIGPMIYGPDGHLYFDVVAVTTRTNPHRLARLESNGTVTVFPTANPCGVPSQFVIARNALYFIGNNGTAFTLCQVTFGGSFKALSAPFAINYSSNGPGITADNDGDIWTVNLFGNGLYSYNIATAQTTGPYEPGILNDLYSLLYTGPDENIYFYGRYQTSQVFFGCYVRHLETIIPSTMNLSGVNSFRDFYVSEPVRNERWYAVSLNPAVAAVTPASSPIGRFKVTETGTGTTSIVVTDSFGNIRYEPVTAN